MAKARAIPSLDATTPTRYCLASIFTVRIAELWSWAPHLHYPERVSELHDMRISAKRLRYCFEFFASSFGPQFKGTLDRFKKLQDFLGEIHDCDVWVDYLRRELAREFKVLNRERSALLKHVGANPALGVEAGELADKLADGAAQGLLQMMADVSARRQRLYEDLVTYWDRLETRDFRGELLKLISGAVFRGGALPVAAPPVDVPEDRLPDQPAGASRVAAALDIGSNSVKLLVARINADGVYEVLADRNAVTGLGTGVSASGALDPEAAQRTVEVLTGLIEEARSLGAAEIRAAGTAAMRSAANPELVTGPLRELGVEVRILSGDEEAQLARVAAVRELPPDQRSVVFFDTGGGSTELTWLRDGEVLATISMPVGARRCTELAGIAQPVSAAAQSRLREIVAAALAESAPAAGDGVFLAGLGGTATVLAWMQQGEAGLGRADPHKAVLTAAQLQDWQQRLAGLTLEEVKAWPNLEPLRADVIYAGLTIILMLMEHYGAESFTVIDRGLRYGLLSA